MKIVLASKKFKNTEKWYIASFKVSIDKERYIKGIYLPVFDLKEIIENENVPGFLLFDSLCKENEKVKKIIGKRHVLDFHHTENFPITNKLIEVIADPTSKGFDEIIASIEDTKKEIEKIIEEVNRVTAKYNDFITQGKALKKMLKDKKNICPLYVIQILTQGLQDDIKGFIYLGAGYIKEAKRIAEKTKSKLLLKEIEKRQIR